MKKGILFFFLLLSVACSSTQNYSYIHNWISEQARVRGDSLIAINEEHLETINNYMKIYYFTAKFRNSVKIIKVTDSLEIFTAGNNIIAIQNF
jgi:hypothetical protein